MSAHLREVCFFNVLLLCDVTVEVNQSEEVETQRRRQTTQHPVTTAAMQAIWIVKCGL